MYMILKLIKRETFTLALNSVILLLVLHTSSSAQNKNYYNTTINKAYKVNITNGSKVKIINNIKGGIKINSHEKFNEIPIVRLCSSDGIIVDFVEMIQ